MIKILFKTILIVFLIKYSCFAVCTPQPSLNPAIDVAWTEVFPMKIGGVTVVPGSNGLPPIPDSGSSVVCSCPAPPPVFVRYGIYVSFWEPARMIETVKDPYCFPTLGGATIGSAPNGTLSGGSDEKEDGNSATFSQSHYYIFPVWSLMEIMTDSVCFQGSSKLDIGYITELDPFWQSDSMAMLFQPEVLLFANPIAQLSCIADSISSNLGFPLSALFWCAGSHGSVYPLTGAVNDKNLVQAQMTIAERMIYKLSRQALIWDPAIWACAAMPTPIWVKQNYRFQLSKPIRTLFSHPPGRSDLLWGSLKNPPTGGDNFTWIVFRKRLCCAF